MGQGEGLLVALDVLATALSGMGMYKLFFFSEQYIKLLSPN